MKRVFLSVVVLCIMSIIGRAQAEATYDSYHSGNRYDFHISYERLANSPVWSTDQDCPPLAPRAAIKIARVQLKKLFSDSDKWTNWGVELTRLDRERWVYLVQFFEPASEGNSNHLTSPFRIPVLMNGKTIEPKVSL